MQEAFKYMCKHFVDLCSETRVFGECIFANKYWNSLSFIFLILIAFYMSKYKPWDGLLNFRLEANKVVAVSCDCKSQTEFLEQFSFPFISEY